MKKTILSTLLGIAILAVILLPRGADALTLSPPYFDYSLNPGDTVLDVIKLFNEGRATETYYPIVMNFSADDDEAGAPQFYAPEEDRMGQGLADWIQVDPSPIVIPAGGRANVQFSINVPKDDATPGGHYGAILLSTAPPADMERGIGVSQQLASIMLVRVSGEVQEVGGIAEFGFKNPQVWYNHTPIEFFLRFENSGNVHLRPTGNLIIKNWLNQNTESIKVNPEFKSVLPMSIRRYEFAWGNTDKKRLANMSPIEREIKNFGLGKYSVQLIINYGSTNQVLVREKTFYVWPWRLMVFFGVGLLVLLVIAWILKRAYDKSLLRKFEKMKKEMEKKPAAEPVKEETEEKKEE